MSSAVLGVAGTVALAGTVASAGVGAYSVYSSNKNAKEARSRNAAGELGMLNDQANGLGRDQLGMQGEYLNRILEMNPAYAAQQRANNYASAKDILKLYPSFAAAERLATSKTRKDDLGDLNKYGAGYMDAFARESPGFAALLAELNRPEGLDSVLLQKLNLDALGAGRSEIGSRLEQNALEGLDLGRSLSPDEERAATQSARGAFASRGLGFSNAALGAEILNRDEYGTQREAGRRQFASGVQGLLMQEDQLNRGFGLDVVGASDAVNQSRRGFLLNASEATSKPLYGMLNTRAPDSIMNGVVNAAGLGMNVGLPGQVAQGAPNNASYIPSLYNYGADAFNTNLNMMESRSIRSANQQSALTGALVGAAGQIGGSYLSNYGLGGTRTIAGAQKATYVGPGTSAQFR